MTTSVSNKTISDYYFGFSFYGFSFVWFYPKLQGVLKVLPS